MLKIRYIFKPYDEAQVANLPLWLYVPDLTKTTEHKPSGKAKTGNVSIWLYPA